MSQARRSASTQPQSQPPAQQTPEQAARAKEILTLKVAQQEIATISSPNRAIYTSQQNGIWFLTPAPVATEQLKVKLQKLEKEEKVEQANRTMKQQEK